ncbi:predicted protein [Methanosarcina acetivorans C2A]|uniref:Uncharacterized protein n=1 Tax=Methanosarcina acetivorans (strain ATCC 35395 / DSM 2834 / JCM 12185 / C2A) TaxID=188937 RepID=Q8TRL5_METAC|nr:predicted protein [Methanosarcina acetivorans C2A]
MMQFSSGAIKNTKIKVGETWVTYSSSTEHNSASENEVRSYNIITLSIEGLEISRRTIPTRNFLFITAKIDREIQLTSEICHSVKSSDPVIFGNSSTPVVRCSFEKATSLSNMIIMAATTVTTTVSMHFSNWVICRASC